MAGSSYYYGQRSNATSAIDMLCDLAQVTVSLGSVSSPVKWDHIGTLGRAVVRIQGDAIWEGLPQVQSWYGSLWAAAYVAMGRHSCGLDSYIHSEWRPLLQDPKRSTFQAHPFLAPLFPLLGLQLLLLAKICIAVRADHLLEGKGICS